jgi:surfactin synthase thioesterase subunit
MNWLGALLWRGLAVRAAKTAAGTARQRRPGDHFFLRSEEKTKLQIILHQLEPFTMKA